MTRQIAETAGELGASLTDIVWSLRPEATGLESLANHLARRAESMFPNDAQFHTRFPEDWNGVKLSMPVRRNVLLIALESIHNAAKHARAENVTLEFSQSEGRKWRMAVEDDGRGLQNSVDKGYSGMGIQNMVRRASEIGAEIDFISKDGRGTVVLLTFSPQAKEHY
jgi:signal transduction histidine kinase